MPLSVLKIRHAKPGMHADGNGLYLRVQAAGSKAWIFRYQLAGRRRSMGLGTLADVPPVEARARAAEWARLVKAGVDPIEERDRRAREAAEQARVAARAAAATTFREVAEDYITSHRSGWRNPKHAQQWTNTLAKYAFPKIGGTPVAEVSVDDVLRILRPLWTIKTETASRVRSRIELVLSFAKALGLRQGENPAAWRGHLDALLPPPGRVRSVRHHPALPYTQVPQFMTALTEVGGTGARALEFAILTATRSGEVRRATWAEIDLEAGVWTIPASRMKAKREHRVPLSGAALQLLRALPRVEGESLLFAGARRGAPLSDMTLAAAIKRMNEIEEDGAPRWIDPTCGAPVVPHGFRSAFRDWAAERTAFPSEVIEMALAHTVRNKVEAAYRRGDLFEKRRELMEAWAAWCSAAEN